MPSLKLKIACLPYEHARPSRRRGEDRRRGRQLPHRRHPVEHFEPMIRDHAFEVAELGLTYVLRLLDQPDPPFVALPIFLARVFRHSAVYINTSSGIRAPSDLAGKIIGEFGMYGYAGGVWPKGIFATSTAGVPNSRVG